MAENDERPVSPTYMGFQRWIKLSVDDFPLIRPPKRHMLSHVTGGLTELYNLITEDKKTKENILNAHENSEVKNVSETEEQLQNKVNAESSHLPQSPSSTNEDKIDEKKRAIEETEIEKNKTKKKDDEGGGQKYIDGDDLDEDEETSPYTDEEGEFAPEEGIPLLALRYKYVEVLARGQSALIVKALDTFAKDKPVAIKVLHRIYKPIGSQEADILLELHRADPWLHVPFARLQNQFIYGPHYCLVFEFLSPTPLYNHYEQKNIKGPTSLPHVRNLCVKLLTVMGFLHKQNVIHADLKPENILLVNEGDMSSVMVIDFGNALRNTEEELSLYYTDFELQTLLYRAPEVIFGLKFSLEIDMWSLGCLLAECYTGEPLFMGKTKEDILAKITKLLGPFPKEFAEGECADLFSEFIGRPATRFERVENLRKKLSNCQDINFLLLLENLLTYLPERRISPFEAACHPFIASVNPFLYLSASQEHKRYPTVVLDMTTYPYLPGLPNDDTQDKISLDGRKRLAGYSHPGSSTNYVPTDKREDNDESASTKQIVNNESKEDLSNSVAEESHPATQSVSTSLPSSPQPIQNTSHQTSSSTSPVQTPSTSATSPVSTTQQTNTSQPNPVKSPPLKSPQSESSQPATQTKQTEKRSKEDSKQSSKDQNNQNQGPGGNFSRTDVKQTLKSMGLRCEDFTISVYSREQAHAILRKQGVEVTNHLPQKQQQSPQQQQPPPPQQPQAQPTQPQPTLTPTPTPSPPSQSTPPKTTPKSQRQGKHAPNPNLRPSVSVVRSETNRSQAPPPPATPASKVDDDDDDDCVILDPPEGPKPPPPPTRRFPQQFQLMGTTVQVNRGSKRQMRSMSHAPLPKRQFSSRSYYYNEGYQYEETPEASVQDTLKRLKNYNISITCRRNSSQRHPRVHTMDSDSSDMDHDGSHLDSEDEEDMAKYLECEIDEEKDISMEGEEGEETLELDSSGSVNDLSSENLENSVRNKKGDKRGDKSEGESADEEKLNSTVEVEDEGKEKDQGDHDMEKQVENEKDNIESSEKEEEQKEISESSNDKTEASNVPKDAGAVSLPDNDLILESKDVPNIESKDITHTELETNSDKSPKIDNSNTLSQEISSLDQDIDKNSNNTEDMQMEKNVECKSDIISAIPENQTTEDQPLKEKQSSENGSKNIEPPVVKDVCDNLDDDINEELEKQLLEAGNLEDDDFEGEDMEGECLENYDLESEL